MSLALQQLIASPLPTELTALLEAIEWAEERGAFAPTDVERVEAFWELLEDDADAHGFILVLRDGRRVYLDFFMMHHATVTQGDAEGGDEDSDDRLNIIWLDGDERPQLCGGRWIDDVTALNTFLRQH